MTDHYFEEGNLSRAWAWMVDTILRSGSRELAPAIVSVTKFGEEGLPLEDGTLRQSIDNHLARRGKQSIETVASTIFPAAFWNPSLPRARLYERFMANLPRLKRVHHLNRRGMYFERMISGGPAGSENQLEFAISGVLDRRGIRRSALQLGIFQPGKDHSRSARMGFPCLQHVTFAPTTEGLHVNATYATQFAIERAYGNYLGLCRLGAFIAHELDLPLAKMTCFAGVMHLDDNKRDIRLVVPMRGDVGEA